MTTEPTEEQRSSLVQLRNAHQDSGWVFWYGTTTRQYWAAHTRLMVLLYAEEPHELDRAAHQVSRWWYSTARPPAPRLTRRVPRPRPREHRPAGQPQPA
ncbi:hypothetical protein FHX37_1851 [Haloactinospora alba]|uniref:Uncharacterized protein n=1 Tax=Haloactinospora alba TaxID=405555 RepID=A0A543NJD6_9ACTN|nr:hypothetical protein [Haloactinospora alba]TQN31927.1 hypothetical protein FHX37_1851 [Haloactinospora alba]